MEIIEKFTKELIPYANNPRENDGAVDAVAASIKEFGFKVPVIIDKDNIIVAGHTRIKAAGKLGIDKVPCIIADDLSEEQIKAFRLADNKVGELAQWDFSKLEEELKELSEMDLDFQMDEFGFSEIGGGTEQTEIIEDDFDDTLPEEPKAKLGDIYELGDHRLICGDSTDVETIDRLMDGNLADMVFTDPPYGVSYTDKNEFLNSIDNADRLVNAIENDSKKPEEMHDFWVEAFTNLYIHTKQQMSYYITAPQGGDLLLLLQAIRESGFALKHQLVWNKNNHVLGRCDYNYKHEPIIYGWKLKGIHKFYGNGTMKTSVWDVNKPLRSDLHPTMKPIELIVNALKNSAQKGDIILDLFGGSGSTLIASEEVGCRCFMCELDPHYIDVIIGRWEKLTGKKAKLLNGE